MPELPELNAAVDQLRELILHRRVERVDVAAISPSARSGPLAVRWVLEGGAARDA